MDQISFYRHRFPPEIIRYAVWLYAKFTLSFRDVEDLLAERGLDVSYESVRRWCLKFGLSIARNLRTNRPAPSEHWHLDEMVIVIRGKRYWLGRAVDNEGEVLDFLVQLHQHQGRRKAHAQAVEAATCTNSNYDRQAPNVWICVQESWPEYKARHRQAHHQPS